MNQALLPVSLFIVASEIKANPPNNTSIYIFESKTVCDIFAEQENWHFPHSQQRPGTMSSVPLLVLGFSCILKYMYYLTKFNSDSVQIQFRPNSDPIQTQFRLKSNDAHIVK